MDYEELTKNNVVAIQPQQNTMFSKIDFIDIVSSTNPADIIILNLNLNHMIDHTLPKIDRCCKLNDDLEVKYDGIDNIQRIDCNIPKNEFLEKYVIGREAVLMKGCQNEWMARNWTIENLLDRYRESSLSVHLVCPTAPKLSYKVIFCGINKKSALNDSKNPQ